MGSVGSATHREPWSKGKIVGQKAPFKLKDIWALRVRLQMEDRVRALALFNLGIDSTLRGCDLVALKVRDVCHGDQLASRAVVVQHKTQRPVQFEITPATRDAVQKWIKVAGLKSDDFLLPSRIHDSPHSRKLEEVDDAYREVATMLHVAQAKAGDYSAVVVAPQRYFGDVDQTVNQRKPMYVALTRAKQAAMLIKVGWRWTSQTQRRSTKACKVRGFEVAAAIQHVDGQFSFPARQ